MATVTIRQEGQKGTSYSSMTNYTIFSTALQQIIVAALTFFFHVDLKAFFEPAGLTLVPPGHIYHAVAILFADVVQVPETKSKFNIVHRCWWHNNEIVGDLHCGQSPDGSLEEPSAAVA